MNRLIIIGNGFDLAHGLKTRYSDFMLDYLKEFLKDIKVGGAHSMQELIKDDDFIQAHTIQQIYKLKTPEIIEKDTLQDIIIKFENEHIKVRSNFVLIQRLLSRFSINNWVDIENEYFQLLREYALSNNGGLVASLNKSFKLLKDKFIEYLCNIEFKVDKNDSAYKTLYGLMYKVIRNEDDWNFNAKTISGNILMLNFNYSNTVDVYIQEQHNLPNTFAEEIKIHGELRVDSNPIIFGYGDDHHENYLQIERANSREYLINMKHMHYSRTNNYEVLLNFLNTGNLPKRESKYRDIEDFQVLVLGHSCGLSDRTMLKTIFEHKNCKEIHLAYFGDKEDHFYKTIEVSRHFSDKAEMRRKLKSINKYLKMPQFQKSNQ